MTATATNPRFVGHCGACGRDGLEVQTRYSHAAKVLCDRCAERPHSRPSGVALDAPRAAPTQPSAPPKLAAVAETNSYAVTFTDTKPPKLVLPATPAHDDLAGLLAWVTSVLRLDPRHPATTATHEGQRGQDGHVEIRRAGLPAIRFEPAASINSARRFLPALGWQLHPTDGEPYGFRDEHCRRIAHVLRLACGVCAAPDAAQEAAGIIGTFMSSGEPVQGLTTYGTPADRHEAAESLRSVALSPPRYLIDANTGEFVIRVSDLQEAGRRHVGSSLQHGWLDARMQHLGWTRAQLQGYAQVGRDGRKGPHSRCDVYRGHLPPDESVNT